MSEKIQESYDIKDSKIELPDVKKQKKGVDALMSFKAIMKVVDRRRPYEPSDFVPETFIPMISLAMPLAMKIAPMVQYVLMNTHQM